MHIHLDKFQEFLLYILSINYPFTISNSVQLSLSLIIFLFSSLPFLLHLICSSPFSFFSSFFAQSLPSLPPTVCASSFSFSSFYPHISFLPLHLLFCPISYSSLPFFSYISLPFFPLLLPFLIPFLFSFVLFHLPSFLSSSLLLPFLSVSLPSLSFFVSPSLSFFSLNFVFLHLFFLLYRVSSPPIPSSPISFFLHLSILSHSPLLICPFPSFMFTISLHLLFFLIFLSFTFLFVPLSLILCYCFLSPPPFLSAPYSFLIYITPLFLFLSFVFVFFFFFPILSILLFPSSSVPSPPRPSYLLIFYLHLHNIILFPICPILFALSLSSSFLNWMKHSKLVQKGISYGSESKGMLMHYIFVLPKLCRYVNNQHIYCPKVNYKQMRTKLRESNFLGQYIISLKYSITSKTLEISHQVVFQTLREFL